MEVINNFIGSYDRSSYDENFKNSIREITGLTFKKGIKEFNPISIVKKIIPRDEFFLKFKYNDIVYCVNVGNKCLCNHNIGNILICEHNNKLYKIGVVCIKKFYKHLREEQIKKIEQLEKDIAIYLKEINNLIPNHEGEQIRVYDNLIEKQKDTWEEIMDDFKKGLNEIKMREKDILLKERSARDKKYTLQFLISNMAIQNYRNLLRYYIDENKYEHMSRKERRFVIFKIKQHESKK